LTGEEDFVEVADGVEQAGDVEGCFGEVEA